MKNLILMLFITLASCVTYAQENPIPDGYKLKKSPNIIYVYRQANNKPDLSVRNRWNNSYWFKTDKTLEGIYENPNTKEKYIRITIPSASRIDDATNQWVNETAYEKSVTWKAEELVDGSDFNTWLWIKETDFDNLKEEYYSKVKGSFVLSGLAVPFKFRPKIGNQANAIISGDLNIGSFVGARFYRSGNFGVSLGGHFGISSISLNSSNNTALTNGNAETIQGFTYGYGVVFDIKKQFQIGVIGGFDYALGNLSKTYIYQNKNWFSFSLNYKFLDFGNKENDTNKKVADKAKE